MTAPAPLPKVNVAGSLRRTLMLSLIGGSFVLATVLFVILRLYAAQIAQTAQDRILSASVTGILDAASVRDGEVAIELPYAAFSILSTPADDRIFYALYQDGDFLTGYEALPAPDTAAGVAYETTRFDGAPLRIASGTRRLVGPRGQSVIQVVVGQTQENLAGTLREISRHAALIGIGFFITLTIFAAWIISATITPLTRLTGSVTRRGPDDLRPVSAPVPSEMEPLVGSLNSFMARLEASLNQSEEFIAEAAHRVRTPLATVRTYAETMLQRVDRSENRAALRSMVRALDETSRAAGQLLDHAMITFRADHLSRDPVDLSALAGELVRSLSPVAEMRDVELLLDAPEPVILSGDQILLQNALRNLIDNALKFAPIDTAVTVAVSRAGVTICDSGPGFPSGEIGALTTRFKRGSNAGGIIGSGLGLTIALDVATAHGGTLTLRNRKEGGACATLSL